MSKKKIVFVSITLVCLILIFVIFNAISMGSAAWDGSGGTQNNGGVTVSGNYSVPRTNGEDIYGYRITLYNQNGIKMGDSIDIFRADMFLGYLSLSNINRVQTDDKKSHIDYYRDYENSTQNPKRVTLGNINAGAKNSTYEFIDTSLPTDTLNIRSWISKNQTALKDRCGVDATLDVPYIVAEPLFMATLAGSSYCMTIAEYGVYQSAQYGWETNILNPAGEGTYGLIAGYLGALAPYYLYSTVKYDVFETSPVDVGAHIKQYPDSSSLDGPAILIGGGTNTTYNELYNLPKNILQYQMGMGIYTASESCYDVTYDYNTTYAFSGTQYADTGFKVNWDKDFTITETFKVSAIGNRYLLFGNYNGSDAKALNVEINAAGQLRVYIGTGGKETLSATDKLITAGENITVTFTWSSEDEKYTISAKGTKTNISFSNSYAMSGTSANTLKIGTQDCRGSSAFSAINISSLKITQAKTKDAAIGTLPSPTKPDYENDGWYTSASGGSSITSSTVVSQNMTVYARWVSNSAPSTHTNTIIHWKWVGTGGDNKDGTYKNMGTSTFTGTYGTTVTIPSNLVQKYTGYHNTGLAGSYWGTSTWQKKDIGSTFTQPSQNLTIEYIYLRNTYSVKYNANGGTGTMSNSTHTYDESKALTANAFTKTGYTFSGWNTEADGSGTSYANKASVKNLTSTNGDTVTLYAQWTEKTYNVIYVNGSINGGDTYGPVSVKHTATYTLLGQSNIGFSKTGYHLTGYRIKRSANGGEWRVTNNDTNVTSWETAATIEAGNYTYVTQAPGYVMKTYHQDCGGTVWLYAEWAANTVKIAYYANGGTVSSDAYSLTQNGFVSNGTTEYFHTIQYGKSDNPVNASTFGLTKPGYTFAGWQVKSTKEVLDQNTNYASTVYAQHNDSNKTTANTTTVTCYLYAQWTPKTYNITCDKQDGSSGTTTFYEKYNTGYYSDSGATTKISKITVPTRTGYTFGGYYTGTNGSGTQVVDASGTIKTSTTYFTSNTTIYAKWTEKTYNVLYVDGTINGGDTYGPIPVKHTATYTLLGQADIGFSKTGYHLTGYRIKRSANGGEWRVTNNDTNVTSWETAATIEAGNYTYVTQAPGYVMKTYHQDCGGTVWLYAQWTVNTVKIRYNVNGGTLLSSSSYKVNVNGYISDGNTLYFDTLEYGKSDDPYNDETFGLKRDGYTFAGWEVESTGKVLNETTDYESTIYAQFDDASKTTANTTTVICCLKAKWTINQVKIAYDAMGGTLSSSSAYSINSSGFISNGTTLYFDYMNYNQSDDPYDAATFGLTKPGYTFGGWRVRSTGEILDQTTERASTVYAQHDDASKTTANTATVYCYLEAVWTANSYTNTISHWAFGFKNKEGNNSSGKAFHLQNTSFAQAYGGSFILDEARAIAIPNGFYLDTKGFGTSSISGSWQTHSFGTSVVQTASNMSFQYDYQPISYSITYNLNGGTNNSNNPSTYNVLYGVTLNNPTKVGYTFDGWYINGVKITGINVDANATFSSADDLYNQLASRTTGNLTIEARWTENALTVVYHSNGATSLKYQGNDITENYLTNTLTQTFKYSVVNTSGLRNGNNSNALLLVKEGHTLVAGKEWLIDSANSSTTIDQALGGTGQEIAEALNTTLEDGSKTVHVYANWAENTLTVIYHSNGATFLKYRDDDITEDYLINNLTQTFKYSVINNSGLRNGNNTSALFLTKTGNTFTGYWLIDSPTGEKTISQSLGGNGQQLAEALGTTLIDGSKTVHVYAQWSINVYTIIFNGNGGSDAPSSQTKTHGEDIKLTLEIPARAEHEFLGWSTDKNGGGILYQPGDVYKEDADATLYAQWAVVISEAEYVVKHYKENTEGSGYILYETEELKGNVNAPITVYPNEYYGFSGYQTKYLSTEQSDVTTKSGAVVIQLNIAVDGSSYVEYYYNKTDYTITYVLNGGIYNNSKDNYVKECKAFYEETLITPTKDGGQFLGWYLKADESSATEYVGQAGDKYTILRDITLYAKWKTEDISVDAVEINGTIIAGQQMSASAVVVNYGTDDIINTNAATVMLSVTDDKNNEVFVKTVSTVIPHNNKNLVTIPVDIPANIEENTQLTFTWTINLPANAAGNNLDASNDISTTTTYVGAYAAGSQPEIPEFSLTPNSEYSAEIVPDETRIDTFVWETWTYENGQYKKNTYQSATPENALIEIVLTPQNIDGLKSQNGIDWTTRSGYGFTINALLTVNKDVTIGTMRAAMLFPEFNYSMTEGLFEDLIVTKMDNAKNYVYDLRLQNNIKGNAMHYTPMWYADGEYITVTRISGLWTPLGEINYTIKQGDSVISDTFDVSLNKYIIQGSLYDDMYLTHDQYETAE